MKSLPGEPDLVFVRAKVAVFCDGDFWHGREWPRLAEKLAARANATYWLAKISSNRSRDKVVNHTLARMGFLPIRVWESDIKNDAMAVASRLKALVSARLGAQPVPRGEKSGADGP